MTRDDDPSLMIATVGDICRLEAKLDQLLALLRTDGEAAPARRCACGEVRYLTRDGHWHCDYCEGVPKREFTDGGMPHVFQVPTSTPSQPWVRIGAAYDLKEVEKAWDEHDEAVRRVKATPIHDPNGGR